MVRVPLLLGLEAKEVSIPLVSYFSQLVSIKLFEDQGFFVIEDRGFHILLGAGLAGWVLWRSWRVGGSWREQL